VRLMPKSKPSLTIIGAGRLGTAMAIALSSLGYPIQSLVSRHRARLKQAARLLDDKVPLLALEELQQVGQLVLITTPDDQLSSVTNQLCTLGVNKRRVALHTSGALSSKILSPLANRGWRVGSIHPLVSVSEPKAGAKALISAFWCLEGDRHAVQQARSIVKDLRGHSFSIESSAKPLYHAAAVMSSGNIVALFDTALDMLERSGLKRDAAHEVLIPLLQSTMANLSTSSPAKALTGTFSRGDVATVQRHLKALNVKELRDARELYRLLGRKSLVLAEENGLDKITARKIRKLLE
jgi:predicted short-subunit dehydrogenase-like oxidoreductase (DUF2520 family)